MPVRLLMVTSCALSLHMVDLCLAVDEALSTHIPKLETRLKDLKGKIDAAYQKATMEKVAGCIQSASNTIFFQESALTKIIDETV